jgi:hypothetical protein
MTQRATKPPATIKGVETFFILLTVNIFIHLTTETKNQEWTEAALALALALALAPALVRLLFQVS